jgi:pantoate--beta-alanine ligase
VREPDGLAMSSRNVYLDATQRAVAPAVYAALCKLQDVHGLGERDTAALRGAAAAVIARDPNPNPNPSPKAQPKAYPFT